MSRRAALLLALLAVAPALALAQAQGATGGATGDATGEEDNGVRSLFRSVPRGADGAPLEYRGQARRPPSTSVPADLARLRLLDKMTGLVATFEMAPGDVQVHDRLEIAMRACRVPEEDARADAWAYLEIRDLREDDPRFAGWMFASSPALSALDHQRYDVWVLSCSASSGETSAESE